MKNGSPTVIVGFRAYNSYGTPVPIFASHATLLLYAVLADSAVGECVSANWSRDRLWKSDRQFPVLSSCKLFYFYVAALFLIKVTVFVHILSLIASEIKEVLILHTLCLRTR